MVADSVEELHAFAASIGMKRCWYQGPKNGRLPHYDLVPSKRQLAVEHGAIEISRKELVERIRKHREAEKRKGKG